jgi:ATP-dependent protease HslVU (ClpYQ) peptidase subunit
MTAIVGLVHDGKVLIGADSGGVAGWTVTVRKDSKLFANGAYVMGFTSSFRMGQLLRWAFKPPAPGKGSLERFMCTTWVDAARRALRDGGWATKEADREIGGVLLVGVRGRLFRIDEDWQVGEHVDGYAAVGSGEQLSLGALAATENLGLDPEKRVLASLEAAERHNLGVRGPFHLMWEKPRRGTIRMEDTA